MRRWERQFFVFVLCFLTAFVQSAWSIWSSRIAAGRGRGVGLGFGGCLKGHGEKDPPVLLGAVLAASPVFCFDVMFVLVPE